MFSKLAVFAALFALAAPVTRGAVHNVTVGGKGASVLKFNPQSVVADPGDTVFFIFEQKNHTVTQSSLNSPCSPLENGFDSGFFPVADDATDFPVAQFQVEDTNPVWVYCRQANHCQQGMVFAINPGNKLSTFQSNAAASNTSTSASTSATVASSSATATAPAGSQSVVTVTATVTVGSTTQTTTYGSYPGSAAPTAVNSQEHTIMVGQNGTLSFSPSNITAQVGDTLTFRFAAKNHTVTQSSFANPCSPLAETSTNGQVGFDSGFMPVPASASDLPSFQLKVNDTAPIWVFCKQTNPANHCAAGMVFSVNAIETGPNNFGAFQAKAKASGSSATGSGANQGANGAAQTSHSAGVLVAVFTALVCALVL